MNQLTLGISGLVFDPDGLKPSLDLQIADIVTMTSHPYNAQHVCKLTDSILRLEKERRAALKGEMDSVWKLVQKVGKASRDIELPKTSGVIEGMRQEVLSILQDLVTLVSNLRQARGYSAHSWWKNKWRASNNIEKVPEDLLQRVIAVLCGTGWENVFGAYDLTIGLLDDVCIEQLKLFSEWTQRLYEYLGSVCSDCKHPPCIHMNLYLLMEWKRMADATERFQKPAVIGAQVTIEVLKPTHMESKVIKEEDRALQQQVDASRETENRAPKKTGVPGRSHNLKENQKNLQKDVVTKPQTSPSKCDARASKEINPFLLCKQERWANFGSAMTAEKPCGGHSIGVTNTQRLKQKTRPEVQQKEASEIMNSVKIATSNGRKWRFTDPTHFATWRQIFPLPGKKEKESNISWNAFREVMEAEPLNFTMIGPTGGVMCTFERPAMDGLPKMSFGVHRPHSLKPDLERRLIQILKTRLRHKFDWEAEDFELVQENEKSLNV